MTGTMTACMRVLVTGSSGLIGTALVRHLQSAGHAVVPLSRKPPVAAGAWWDPEAGRIDLSGAGRIDAVVHLAGENIGTFWTRRKKRRIRQSRIEGTRLLSEALARLEPHPVAMVSASASGFYGDRGDERLDETSRAGEGFLAEVARDWEQATAAVEQCGARVVHLRSGMVLSSRGGALRQMLPLFRLGLGGRLGNGRQYWSWIVLEDVVRVILHALESEQLTGPVNNVAPGAVTNLEFTRMMGKVLKRPTFCAAPEFALRLGLGEMAKEVLLASTRVEPARLKESGFEFEYPELRAALESSIIEGVVL